MQRFARGDDHADFGIVLPGDVRKLDAVHIAGELHVGHHQNQAAAGALQDEFSRFGAFAFDDIDLALLQQQANHVPLHRVVFDNEGGRAKRF